MYGAVSGSTAGSASENEGQERDAETNLDFFQARYLSSGLGRFMSPDPANAGADPTNPQSWNAYAYVSGDPLNTVDPSGMTSCTSSNNYCGLGFTNPGHPPYGGLGILNTGWSSFYDDLTLAGFLSATLWKTSGGLLLLCGNLGGIDLRRNAQPRATVLHRRAAQSFQTG